MMVDKQQVSLNFLSVMNIHVYRSFSRDATPFPVGYIGVPLSIA